MTLCCPAVNATQRIVRLLLPWLVSGVALVYVFGYRIDWEGIPRATAGANMPLFLAITVADKIVFFLVWGILQAQVIRRFVEPVSTLEVLQIKGGSELVRTVNNSLADAAFLFGVSQLTRGQIASVIAVAGIPFGCHFGVLLVQATLALPFAPGGVAAHSGTLLAVAIGWSIVALIWLAMRLGF